MGSYKAFKNEDNLIKMVAQYGAASLSNRYDFKLGLVHSKVAENLAKTGLYEIFTGPDSQRMIRKVKG